MTVPIDPPRDDEDPSLDDEMSDDDETQDSDELGRPLSPILGVPIDDPQAQADAEAAELARPRNRAERRAQARSERRGVTDPGGPASAAVARTNRPRVPPMTVSGKSSADEVPPWAREAASSMARHARTLAAAAVGVVLVAGAGVGWVKYTERREAQAGALLASAIETAVAPVRPADAPADPPGVIRRGPTYPDAQSRARAALEAARSVVQRFPASPSAPLAHLVEATALYDLGRHAEARPVFAALEGKDLGGLEGRMLQGQGYNLEALHDLPAAMHTYEQLAQIQDGALRDTATLDQARVLHAQGNDARARELLHTLLTRLSRTRPDDPLGPGSNASVVTSARSLLRDIDPDDAQARAEPAAIDPEMLQRLLRGAGARPPAGSAPPASGH